MGEYLLRLFLGSSRLKRGSSVTFQVYDGLLQKLGRGLCEDGAIIQWKMVIANVFPEFLLRKSMADTQCDPRMLRYLRVNILKALYVGLERPPEAIKDVRVDFDAKADPKTLAVENLRAEAEKIKMEGWYQREANTPLGKLLIRYGKLEAAIGVKGEDFEWKLINAQQWYGGR